MKEIRRMFSEHIADPFSLIWKGNRALWGINAPYFIEGLVYFGIITLLTKFVSENIGLGDVVSGWVVAGFTGGITGMMFLLGGVSDRWGLRRSLLTALALMVIGRILLATGGTVQRGTGLLGTSSLLCLAGLAIVAIGYGLYQPAAYAGVKRFTTEKTAAMGYAMIYGLMNLGSFGSGLISPSLRHGSERWFPPNGIGGVFWVYTALTVMALLSTALLLTPRAMQANANALPEPDAASAPNEAPKLFSRAWFAGHPLANAKFSFFIFILIPVQTLFAHAWLTMPVYIERAFAGQWVSKNFELVDNINPLLIFLLTPLIAALTARKNMYSMMIAGTAVMAIPTFLLALGPSTPFLLIHIAARSIGEAMWQPRFLQYAAELAPPGKTGLYMGVAQFPWFLTKVLTGVYSGWFLAHYCPLTGPHRTETLWLIYALITCVSPIGLYLARTWATAEQAPSRRQHIKNDGCRNSTLATEHA